MGEPDADAIAAAALACPGVAGLHGGTLNEFAAYLPGRSVAGVRLAEEHVEVHLVARYGTVLPSLAEEVRGAVLPLAGGRPVEIHIDDIDHIDDIHVGAGQDGTIDVTDAPEAARA